MTFWGLLLGGLALVPLSYFFIFRDPPAATLLPTPHPAAAFPELKLARAEGGVQVRHGRAWAPAHAGESLRTSDGVRTEEGATALLVNGDDYEVRVESGTEVAVGELTDSISRILLANGMATATVRAGPRKHRFEVHAVGSDAVARVESATFSVSNDGQGLFAVGTTAGEVELQARDKVVIVRAGQRSTVRPNEAPSAPTALPTSLLLKVQWPAQGTLNRRHIVLEGQADPAALVDIGGRPVKVDASGHFSFPLELSEGGNALTVRARAVGAVRGEERHSVEVDTTPPRMGLDKDLWKR